MQFSAQTDRDYTHLKGYCQLAESGKMDISGGIIDHIQGRGERITLPRRLVIEALGQSHQHLTISDIQQHIQAYHNHLLSDTTIYRVLQWLKDLELVSQTDMGQTGIVYALMSHPPHHHLICLICGNIEDIEDTVMQPLRDHLLNQHGFLPRIDHMAFYGICRECRSKPLNREDVQNDE
jgi:Fur family ferric uptake transcriptional regulator